MQSQAKQSGIFAGLALLMAATRYNHFGSAVSLPDASLAVFFLAGFFLAWRTWPALLGFVVLLLEAGGMDYYATATQGVSDWCITPAYWFLVPTYATLWLGGAWVAARQDNTWRDLTTSGGVAWLATTIAFLISNVSFYLLSGRVADMSAVEYASAVAKYYPPYVGGSFLYLAVAALLYVVLTSGRKESVDTARN